MISAVTSATDTQPVTPGASSVQKTPEAKSQSRTDIHDTVHLSSAAQAQVSSIKAAVQEAAETPAQTGKEARAGDRQAQRLLAREAQAAKVAEGNE